MAFSNSPQWDRMPEKTRINLIWYLWLVTWIGLLLGLLMPIFYELVVLFSALHACFFLFLLNFRLTAFPVQVRFAYFAWVAAGTYLPYMQILLYITIVGLATNLFLGYCPLARMMYLLPWNRKEPFSFELARRVFCTPPVEGQFKLR